MQVQGSKAATMVVVAQLSSSPSLVLQLQLHLQLPRRLPLTVPAAAAGGARVSAAGERLQPSPRPSISFSPLQNALSKKDGDAVKEALDQLGEAGWAKLWNSQPYVSRRSTFIRELTSLGIKNAEKLGIPSVQDDLSYGRLLAALVSLPSLPASFLGIGDFLYLTW